MPQTFKAIVTISVWVLFIQGLLGILLGGFYIVFTEGATIFNVGTVWSSIGTVSLIAAAVAAKLRQMLE